MSKGLIRAVLPALFVLYVVCARVRCGGGQTQADASL